VRLVALGAARYMPLEGMEEPQADNSSRNEEPRSRTPLPSRTRWVAGAVVLVVAAVTGMALGAGLGSRQGGPLSAQGVAGGRPTIVVASAGPSPSASPGVVAAASPSAVGTPGSSSAAVAGSTTYVVQPGDTLRSIAQDQYGDATLWPRIYDANRDVIGSDPDALNAGTKLQIPPQQ